MCRLIEAHPRSAPWVSGALASAVYALLTWLMEDDRLVSHALEIAVVGIAVFLVVRWKGRHSAQW